MPPPAASGHSRPLASRLPSARAERLAHDLPGAVLAMVDNFTAARPQSGLDRADVVYEAWAETGITRFLAVFYRHAVDRIGPIRSARFYFVYLADAYRAPYAHAGANADALALLARDRYLHNADQIYGSAAYFWRGPDRRPPFNLYTSTERLLAAMDARGWQPVAPPTLPVGRAPGGGRPARRVRVLFSVDPRQPNEVDWRYSGGRYLRSEDGRPHLLQDGAQIATPNLVVIQVYQRTVMKEQIETDLHILGSGPALLVRDGRVWGATWSKPDRASHLELAVGGVPARFAPGPVWYEIVPSLARVTLG